VRINLFAAHPTGSGRRGNAGVDVAAGDEPSTDTDEEPGTDEEPRGVSPPEGAPAGTALVVIAPSAPRLNSVNHIRPSGPAVM
jgi:hypothetical protein